MQGWAILKSVVLCASWGGSCWMFNRFWWAMRQKWCIVRRRALRQGVAREVLYCVRVRAHMRRTFYCIWSAMSEKCCTVRESGLKFERNPCGYVMLHKLYFFLRVVSFDTLFIFERRPITPYFVARGFVWYSFHVWTGFNFWHTSNFAPRVVGDNFWKSLVRLRVVVCTTQNGTQLRDFLFARGFHWNSCHSQMCAPLVRARDNRDSKRLLETLGDFFRLLETLRDL